MKIMIALVLVGVISGGAIYVKNLIADNATLEHNLATQKTASDSYIKAIATMDKELKLEQKISANSEKKRQAASKALIGARKKLSKVLTNEEKECFSAEIPDPVINGILSRLRPSNKGSGGEGGPVALPESNIVFPKGRTPIVLGNDL